MSVSCPECGNEAKFLVKTLQIHVVHVQGDQIEVAEESRPAVLEVLCDECETALPFEDLEVATRREVLLTLGAR